MNFSKSQVQQLLSQSSASRGVSPPVAKARKKTGEGDWARRKAWLAERAREPGIFIGMKTVTEKNTGGARWNKIDRAATQRADAFLVLCFHKPLPPFPVVVTLTRYGPRILDDDNSISALAHCRDGIADAFGCDDSDNGKITWVYAKQVQSPKGCWGVRVIIEAARAP